MNSDGLTPPDSLEYVIHNPPRGMRSQVDILSIIARVLDNDRYSGFIENSQNLFVAIESQFPRELRLEIYDKLKRKPDKSPEDLMTLAYENSLNGCFMEAKAFVQQAVGIDQIAIDTGIDAQNRIRIYNNFELVFEVLRESRREIEALKTDLASSDSKLS